MDQKPNYTQSRNLMEKKIQGKKESIFTSPSQAQVALDKLCVFKRGKLHSKEIQEFMTYVKKVFPNKSNNLGTLMQNNIDEKKALKILKEVDYDVNKAKFVVTFPCLTQSILKNKDYVEHNPTMFKRVFEKFQKKNSMLHQKQEIIHFKDVLEGIEKDDIDISFQDLSLLIKEAKSNKFKIPLKVKREFEESIYSSRQIEKLIEGSKKIEDVEILMEKTEKVLIKPQNFIRLKEFLDSAKKLETEVEQILTSERRSFKEMQAKINPLKSLNLKCSNNEPIHIFKKLFEKCQSHFSDIQQIINPYNTKSNQKKFDFQKIRTVLDYFNEENVQDPKIAQLSQIIHETLQLLSNCQMFLEDKQPQNLECLEEVIEALENSKFDFKSFLAEVKNKLENVNMLNTLREEWSYLDKTKVNLKIIKKLLSLHEVPYLEEIQDYQHKINHLEQFRYILSPSNY